MSVGEWEDIEGDLLFDANFKCRIIHKRKVYIVHIKCFEEGNYYFCYMCRASDHIGLKLQIPGDIPIQADSFAKAMAIKAAKIHIQNI